MKLFSKLLLVAVSSPMLFGARQMEEGINLDSYQKWAPVSLKFSNVIGGQKLVLDKQNYSNSAGEQFNILILQYFVSNIRLRRTDGTEYVLKQDSSYFLINESSPATHSVRFKVPAGDYNRLSFVVGIDSLRNTMDISKRTGVLDPANAMDHGMYWGWNSGYIFFKMEGTSPQAKIDPSGQRKFRYHIGGFGGYSAPTINNIKNVSLDLSNGGIVQARNGRNATVHVLADVLKVFNSNTTVSIAAHPSVMFSEYSVNIANNYKNMFAHERTEN